MATIYLVRHGQASFGVEDYDRLSQIGWQQGRVLGRALRCSQAATAQPQAVFGGTLRRHRETVEAMARGFGDGLPAMQVASGFDEFDHVALIHRHRPEWEDHSVMARDLAASIAPALITNTRKAGLGSRHGFWRCSTITVTWRRKTPPW